jgi:hypothetical protein
VVLTRPGTMRWMTIALLVVLVAGVGGCHVAIPARVAPTLSALHALGMRCGEPQKDNVPSGLLQWRCEGLDRGAALTLYLDGDDNGVFDLMAFVDVTAGTATARDVFVDVVDVLPVFDPVRPAAQSWLAAWSGGAGKVNVGPAFLSVEADETSIVFSAIPGPRRAVGDPI